MFTSESEISRLFVSKARDFFGAMSVGDFDRVWNELISSESVHLISAFLWPLQVVNQGKIDEFLVTIETQPDLLANLAMSIGLDMEGSRTGFFQGFANGLPVTGWDKTNYETAITLVSDSTALLMADTPNVTLLLPFVKDIDDQWRVDFAAMCCFSMQLTTSSILPLAKRAQERGLSGVALSLFELAAGLVQSYQRLRQLMLTHPLSKGRVTPGRQEELARELDLAAWAKSQALQLLTVTSMPESNLDLYDFMKSCFVGYDQIAECSVTDADMEVLFGMNDGALRIALAQVLQGIDRAVIQRESCKPHTASEIADMELPVRYGGSGYMLCMPFKSGREIQGGSVPVKVAYQIVRPFIYLPRGCVVIFITAKPCSQQLWSFIKVARASQGWAIEAIEGKQLAALLKVNRLLR